MKQRRVLLGIGSNVHPVENLARVKTMLTGVLSDIQYSNTLWTEAIGMDAPHFQNCLVLGITEISLEELNGMLKKIEYDCGRTADSRDSGYIPMDIDVLSYGGRKYHEEDWKRPYIQQLLHEMYLEDDGISG